MLRGVFARRLAPPLALVAAVALPVPAAAQLKATQPVRANVEVMFPMPVPGQPAEKPQSGWRIAYAIYPLSFDMQAPAVNPYGGSRVWRITGVEFMRGYRDAAETEPDWVKVLDDLVLTDMHVPYNKGPEYHDISDHPFGFVQPNPGNLPAVGCFSCGIEADGLIAREVVDDGIRWTSRLGGDIAPGDEGDSMNEPLRRGQVMWLWANLAAGNYRYIIKYGFADDGTIRARVGGTAQNLPQFDLGADENGKVDPKQAPVRDQSPAVHLHTGFWRMQFNLGDPDKVHVHVAERLPVAGDSLPAPTKPGAVFKHRDFNSGYEGGEIWDPMKFTSIKIMSGALNNKHTPPLPTGYKLMPTGSGVTRTFRPYTHRDFWLTRVVPDNPRRRWPRGSIRYEAKYHQIPDRIKISRPANLPAWLRKEPFIGEKTAGKAVVLWHQAGLNHMPRTEDFGPMAYVADEGTALIHWAGFDLMPHNLWPKSPFFTPPPPPPLEPESETPPP